MPATAAASLEGQGVRRAPRRVRVDPVVVCFIAVALVFIAVEIVPVAWAVMLGFMHSGPFAAHATYAGLDNYAATFADPGFWSALRIGALYAVLSTALEVVVGVGIAVLLHRHGGIFVRSLTLLPYVVPTVTTALAWRWITDSLYGILDQTLLSLHLISRPIEFAATSPWALTLVILVSTWQFTPFVILVLLANLGTIPLSVYDAALVDGANWRQEFLHITLPILRAPILLVILLRGIWMFNRFDIIWLLTSGGPLGSTTTLPVYAYIKAFSDNDYGLASAASTVIFLLLLVFGIIYIRAFRPEQEVVRA